MTIKNKLPAAIRRQVYDVTRGFCFYCGDPLKPDRGGFQKSHGRDWLIPKHVEFMCSDHMLPLQRGGTDDSINLNPSCGHCNSSKALSTVDEYRFRKGLTEGILPYNFAFDPPPIERDYIVTVSPNFIRAMMVHNFPRAYGHRRGSNSRFSRA